MTDLLPGMVVSTKSFRAIVGEDVGWLEYKAVKGKKMNFLFLGTNDIKGAPLDPISVLKQMGWTIDPQIEEMMREQNSESNT